MLKFFLHITLREINLNQKKRNEIDVHALVTKQNLTYKSHPPTWVVRSEEMFITEKKKKKTTMRMSLKKKSLPTNSQGWDTVGPYCGSIGRWHHRGTQLARVSRIRPRLYPVMIPVDRSHGLQENMDNNACLPQHRSWEEIKWRNPCESKLQLWYIITYKYIKCNLLSPLSIASVFTFRADNLALDNCLRILLL